MATEPPLAVIVVLAPSLSSRACERLEGIFLQRFEKVVNAVASLGLGAYVYLVGGGWPRSATLQLPKMQA